jgi:carbamoylphosphate synthase large subunit
MLAAHEAASEPGEVTGADYVDWCLSFCRAHAIDIFVPGKEANLIARHQRDFLDCGVRVLSAAPPEFLDILHDKARFYATANTAFAPSPACETFNSFTTFDAAYQRMRLEYPELCMKPSVSVYGIGFRQITESKNAIDLLFDGNPYRVDLQSARDMFGRAGDFRAMLLMPYLAGYEFSVDCVACEGSLLCAVARRKPKGGSGGQIIVLRDDIQQACADLTAQFRLNGNVNIQFREGCGRAGNDSALHILEINPRMSGGIGMACLAGPNLPHIALTSFVHGAANLNIPPIQDGLRVGEINKATRLPA